MERPGEDDAWKGDWQPCGMECHLEEKTEARSQEVPWYFRGALEGPAHIAREKVDLEDARRQTLWVLVED